MNSSTLKEILKVKDLSFSKEEIESIMDEELEKSPEEMDAELIDMCLDILTGAQERKADENISDSSAKPNKKVKTIKFKKGMLVAAIITLLITIAIPVGAKIFDIDVPESMLKVYEEYFHLDMGSDYTEDLNSLLAENDLKDTVLPKFLFADDCEIIDFETFKEEDAIQVDFKYADEKKNLNGAVSIKDLNMHPDFFAGETLVDRQYEGAKEITVNGINVVVFNEGNETYITYSVNQIEYVIMLYGVTIEQALEIAGTL